MYGTTFKVNLETQAGGNFKKWATMLQIMHNITFNKPMTMETAEFQKQTSKEYSFGVTTSIPSLVKSGLLSVDCVIRTQFTDSTKHTEL